MDMAWIAGVFVAAGAVKGISGMGLPTVAMSLLGLWMAPAQAAALLVVPALLTNIAQCRGPHRRRLVRALWPAWLGLAASTLLCPPLEAVIAPALAHRLLGGVLLLYGLWGLVPRRGMPPGEQARHPVAPVAGLVGIATGLVTALTGVFVIPLVPWLQTLRLDNDEMVQALGLSFTVATLALGLRVQSAEGAGALWAQVLLALAAALAGLALGGRVRARIGAQAFRRALHAVFIGLGGVHLAVAG